MIKNNYKKIVEKINYLFSRTNFFEKLCKYSENDINIVIRNISKIINYYLVTQDTTISYSIKELIEKSNSLEETNKDILIHPSNSFFINRIKINGLNTPLTLLPPNLSYLEKIDSKVSLFPYGEIDGNSAIYQNIEQAVLSSFLCPNSLFRSILKQPQGKELPFVVGSNETNYYQSVLDIRLKNINEEEQTTNAKIGKKAINSFVGKDALLVLFPRTSKRYDIPEDNIKNNLTGIYVPPTELSYIKLPSKYKLLSICASNKQLRNGELLDINTGQEYKIPVKDKIVDYWPQYSRYEAISITEEFIYTNQEFTGDINYDIDLIYGQLDSNKSRRIAKQDPNINIANIKKRDDIIVRKVGNKYAIRNGRHRILYLKYFYISHYEEYKKDNKLDKLKKYITIPMNVESAIQDKITNEYLLKIFKLYPNTYIYKTDINNDDPNIILTIGDKTYALQNNEEIIKFYNYLLENKIDNEFYICQNDKMNSNHYKRIFDYVVIMLKEKIFNMNLLEIIEYILKEGIIIKGVRYDLLKFNILQMYASYSDLQKNVQLSRLFNLKKDIIQSTINKYKLKDVSIIIMSLIEKNPDLINLSWDEFYEILKLYDELSVYDKEFLKDAADYGGYQKLKLEYLLKEMEYTKRPNFMLK